jgi:hypothetical protein
MTSNATRTGSRLLALGALMGGLALIGPPLALVAVPSSGPDAPESEGPVRRGSLGNRSRRRISRLVRDTCPWRVGTQRLETLPRLGL